MRRAPSSLRGKLRLPRPWIPRGSTSHPINDISTGDRAKLTQDSTTGANMSLVHPARLPFIGEPCWRTLKTATNILMKPFLHIGKMQIWPGGLNGWDGPAFMFPRQVDTMRGRFFPSGVRLCPDKLTCTPLKIVSCCAPKIWIRAHISDSSFRSHCGTSALSPMYWHGNGLPCPVYFC